jgi:hypothetical protein
MQGITASDYEFIHRITCPWPAFLTRRAPLEKKGANDSENGEETGVSSESVGISVLLQRWAIALSI